MFWLVEQITGTIYTITNIESSSHASNLDHHCSLTRSGWTVLKLKISTLLVCFFISMHLDADGISRLDKLRNILETCL